MSFRSQALPELDCCSFISSGPEARPDALPLSPAGLTRISFSHTPTSPLFPVTLSLPMHHRASYRQSHTPAAHTPAPAYNQQGYGGYASPPPPAHGGGGGYPGYSPHQQPPPQRGPPPGADPELWHWFSAVDTDRSGSITVTELQSALVNGTFSLLLFFSSFPPPPRPIAIYPPSFSPLWFGMCTRLILSCLVQGTGPVSSSLSPLDVTNLSRWVVLPPS